LEESKIQYLSRKNNAVKIAIFISLIISILLISNRVYAYENKYEDYANKLKVINVFRGTDKGFELEREPTRVEGGVMFVRLLGGENEALVNNYPHPFLDVPKWADPYIGYLYKYHLTNGISFDKYGSTLHMKAKSYMTFVLRALDYDDKVNDFTWDNALEYAFSLKLVDQDFYTELSGQTFLRDQVAKLSYDALFFGLKKYEATLGEKLVAQGAISKVAANSIGIIDQYYLNNSQPISIFGISLGDTLDKVISTMGKANDILLSRLNYSWYIYNFDYSNYVQFGILNNKVVSFYTTSKLLRTDKHIKIGNYKVDVQREYTAPVKYIEKRVEGDDTVYLYYPTKNECETYILSNLSGYVTYLYDSYTNNQIYGVYVIDKALEEAHLKNFIVPTDTLIKSMDMQTFYITNAIRVINDKNILIWDDKASISATKHCNDMVKRDYFAHLSPEGVTPFTRMKNEGIN